MAHYYSTRPCVITVPDVSDEGEAASEDASEFDKHRETLLSDDAEEGWAPELRRYIKTMQRDVKKDTDIVKWWQVSSSCFKILLFTNLNGPKDHAHVYPTLARIALDVPHLKHRLYPANNYFPVPNKSLLTAEQVWVIWSSKKLPLPSRHGDLGSAMLRLGMLHRRKRLHIWILISSRCWLRMVIRRSGINLCLV